VNVWRQPEMGCNRSHPALFQACGLWQWCTHLDFLEKFFQLWKNGVFGLFLAFVCKNAYFCISHSWWLHIYTETCEKIVHTLPQTVLSTDDPVTIVTLLVLYEDYIILCNCDACRSGICIQPSTTDGALFQFIFLSILAYVRDSDASCKGKLVTWSSKRAQCSWWPAPPNIFQVPNCPEPCHDVTERCRAWWAGAAWSIRLTWPKTECLLRLISSFMDSSCEKVATSLFMTNLYQRMPTICLWFVVWKASSFAISAFNSVHVAEAYSSDVRTHVL